MNRKKEDRLDEEIRHHLEAEARDRRNQGLSSADAHNAALRDFGSVARVKETAREVWGFASLDRLAQDIRYGLRMLRRSPGLTALAVVSLAVGIGANTTVYTIVRAGLSAPAAVGDAGRVVNLHALDSGRSKLVSVNYPDWLAFRDANTAFSAMCAWAEASVVVNAGGETESKESLLVTAGFFETFGLRPAAGRFFDGAEHALPVAVVSHRFWRRHPESLGAVIRVSGHPFTVVGVMPEGFTSPYPVFAPELFLPLQRKGQVNPPIRFDHPGSEYLKMSARLKPGIARQQAEALLPAMPYTYGRKVAAGLQPRRFTLAALGKFPDDIGLAILGAAAFLFAIAGFVLVIACANVGSLLLARATARRHEIGVRLALGAGRARLVRQLVTESVLLFLPAAAAGIGLCWVATSALTRFQEPLQLPVHIDLAVDYGVLLFTLALALAAGVLFGLVPAFQSLRIGLQPFLKETSISGHSRLRNAFLVCEFSLSFVLVMALGIFIDALQRGGSVYPGKDPSRLWLVELDMSTLGYPGARRTAIFDRILEQTQNLPGVQSAAFAAWVPIAWEYSRAHLETLDGRSISPDSNRIGPGYFRTTGIALLRGRDFTLADGAGTVSTPVIVNETMARTEWPGEDPIGKRLRRSDPAGFHEVVGVAADTRQRIDAGPTPMFLYVPAAASSPASLVLHIRASGDPQPMLAAVRNIVRSAEPNIPLQNMSTLQERIRLLMLPHRLAAALAGAFGALGVLLAALGIYGVTSYAVAQRTREIGLRMALGAKPAQIWKTFTAQGTRLIAYALGVAIAVSFGVARVLQDLLYGVPPLDPVAVALIAVTFAGVWLGGVYLPARRAISVDPSRALRWE
jgi:predicted permease